MLLPRYQKYLVHNDPNVCRIVSYSEGVDHGFEAEIDLSGTDDFGDILIDISAESGYIRVYEAYARVIGFK